MRALGGKGRGGHPRPRGLEVPDLREFEDEIVVSRVGASVESSAASRR